MFRTPFRTRTNTYITTGYYFDSIGEHGFVRSADGATFTAIDAPADAGGTVATSIKSSGDAAGYYADASGGASISFVRLVDGKYKAFNPKGSVGTLSTTIDSKGSIAGSAYITGENRGFLRSK